MKRFSPVLTFAFLIAEIVTFIHVKQRISQLASNDAFALRAGNSGASGSTAGSSTGASKEFGEPDHAGNAGGASLWWSWTAPATGTVTFDTQGSDFDTLAVPRKAPIQIGRCLLPEAVPRKNPIYGISGRAAGNVACGCARQCPARRIVSEDATLPDQSPIAQGTHS